MKGKFRPSFSSSMSLMSQKHFRDAFGDLLVSQTPKGPRKRFTKVQSGFLSKRSTYIRTATHFLLVYVCTAQRSTSNSRSLEAWQPFVPLGGQNFRCAGKTETRLLCGERIQKRRITVWGGVLAVLETPQRVSHSGELCLNKCNVKMW